MKIKEIDIISFGKIENSNILLKDGLNVIYGKNESGKSTIASFIESMFFGFGSTKALRQRCIPWGKDSASGSMTVEQNGEYITVFRRMGKTARFDSTVFSPENTTFDNLIPQSRETYLKSVYCRENDASSFGATDEIVRKLINLINSGDENINAAQGIEALEAKRKTLKAFRASSGKLYEIEGKISLLQEEYRKASSLSLTLAENSRKIKELSKEYDLLYSQYEEYSNPCPDDVELNKLDREIANQKAYVDSFPDFSEEYPASLNLFSKALLISIICTFSLFIIGCLTFLPLTYLSPIPVIICLIVNLLRNKKLRKSFLSSYNCSDYKEYQKLILDKEAAAVYYKQLLEQKSNLIKDVSGNEKLRIITKKLLALRDEINNIEKMNASVNIRPLDEILSNISYFSEQKEDTIRKIAALDAAIYALNKAKDKLSRDFTPLINEKAQKYINMIAPKSGRDVSVKSDLSLFLTDPFPEDISNCSQGFKEEIYLCFRLALGEILFPDNFPFILDNPFAASDDYREKALIDLLYSISKKRQVIIFTNRKNSCFSQMDCNYIDISHICNV